jgi:FlaA1/EpsC-like NDP-sugar epimerase
MNSILKKLAGHLRTVRYRWWVLAHDLVMIPLAWLTAYWLRYNLSEIPEEFLRQAWLLLPIVVLVQGVTLLMFGAHRGVWRFTSISDLVRLLKAIVTGTVLVALAIFLYNNLQYVPRSVFFMYGLLLTSLLCGSRVIYRLVKDQHFSTKIEKKALIVGAGAAGEQVVRDLRRNTPRIYDPVAFVDDDPKKIDKDIHGVRVAAGCDAIADLCERWNIDLILIAVPSATDKQMQRIVNNCEQSGVEYRTLPTVHDVVSGHVGMKDLREVRIDDLLGRDPVSLSWQRIRSSLKDKRVLVTGCGGSIGSELCRQLAKVGPAELIMFDQSEYNLYLIEREIREAHPDLDLSVVLGDICDQAAVTKLFKDCRPQMVFHAAAYKHVPMLEGQLREGLKNNVIGTNTVARAAHDSGCATFVLISTDKAVNPSSLMGACKRVAEILCQALNSQSSTSFVTVRFGNVLGSTGSVVPLFRKQIAAGGPVTVTHPDVTRYFMTTAEATQLILEASTVGNGGEIFVLDMGDPIKVAFLAQQMIKLSGKHPGGDIDIVYTGLRPGEKLHEELFYPEERLSQTDHDKILLAANREVEWKVVVPIVERMKFAVDEFDEVALANLLQHLVPELRADVAGFQPQVGDIPDAGIG